MSYFNDPNTLEEIHGSILLAQGYEPNKDEKTSIRLTEKVILRIEAKLAGNTNRTRHNWFSLALGFARQARDAYIGAQPREAFQLLKKTWEHLESGNKAHRRKTAFIVDADGTTHPVKK